MNPQHLQRHTYYNVDSSQRDPPPYPGHGAHFYTPGYRQSYSGSEASTDISLSSSENLSTSARQDPQGEETSQLVAPSFDGCGDSDYSILARLGLPVSGVEVKTTNSSTFYVTGSRSHSASTSPVNELTTPRNEFSQQFPSPKNTVHLMPGALYPPSVRGLYDTSQVGLYGTTTGMMYTTTPGMHCTSSGLYTGTCPGLIYTPSSSNVIFSPSPGSSGPTSRCHTPSLQGTVPGSAPTTTQQLAAAQQLTSLLQTAADLAQRTSPQQQRSPRNLSPQPNSHHKQQHSPNAKSTANAPGGAEQVLPPPPQYPGTGGLSSLLSGEKRELRRSYEMLDRLKLTRSQPDLTRLAELCVPQQHLALPAPNSQDGQTSPQQQHKQQQQQLQQQLQQQQQQLQQQLQLQHKQQAGQASLVKLSPSMTKKMQLDLDHAAIATKATQMVERLSEENRTLRQEIEGYYKRVTKLQQFEVELQKVQTAYEALVRHTAKRENMEKVMKYSLKGEIRRLQETNRELTDQLSKALTQLMQKGVYDDSDSDLKKELGKKDSMITKLLSQNKELGTTKERLEIEVAAQRSTLQEQRSHIEVLDVALTNAQTNVARLEEEVKRHTTKEDQADQLQKIISQLQAAAEKREGIEKQLRGHLEEEIRSLKGQKSRAIRTMELDEGIASDSESPSNVQSLVRQLHEKEEKILRLEADVTRFEQRFLEESALRQLAVDAAAMPKDARIAALEQSSVETEKLIAEAHTDRLKHLEEVYQANRRCAELEAKGKSLQAQLAEKDAMITVLHKHSSLSRTGSISSLLSSPSHSPRPSLPAPSLSPNPSPIPMSMTIPVLTTSSSPSSEPSLQTSQLDKSSTAQGPTKNVHTKSNSTGSTSTSTGSTADHSNKDAQLRELQHKLAAQAALFRCLQTGDQLSKRLWQV